MNTFINSILSNNQNYRHPKTPQNTQPIILNNPKNQTTNNYLQSKESPKRLSRKNNQQLIQPQIQIIPQEKYSTQPHFFRRSKQERHITSKNKDISQHEQPSTNLTSLLPNYQPNQNIDQIAIQKKQSIINTNRTTSKTTHNYTKSFDTTKTPKYQNNKLLLQKQSLGTQQPVKQSTIKQIIEQGRGLDNQPSKSNIRNISTKSTFVRSNQVKNAQIQNKTFMNNNDEPIQSTNINTVKLQSKIICFSINKIYLSNLKHVLNVFQSIRNNKFTKQNTFTKIFIQSTISIAKQYQLYYQNEFFKKIKLISANYFSNKNRSLVTIVQMGCLKQKNILCNLVNYKYRNNLKYSFSKIQKLKVKQKFIAKAIVSLSLLERRKLLFAFNHFKFNYKITNNNQMRLKRIFQITIKFQKSMIKTYFQKILTFNLPKQKQKSITKSISNQISTNKKSVKQQQSIKNEYNIQNIENIQKTTKLILEKKNIFQNQKQNLLQQIKNIKNIIQQRNNQLTSLEKQNSKLKIQLQNQQKLNNPQQSTKNNQTLKKLYTLYIQILNDQHAQLLADQILKKQNYSKYNQKQIQQYHQAIQQNSRLKIIIEKIQGTLISNKINDLLEQQNKMVEKLIKSYVRERYLWQYVKIRLPD